MLANFTLFLKEVPDKWIITLIFLIVLATYLINNDAFLQRLVDAFSGAVIALLVKVAFQREGLPVPNIDSPVFHQMQIEKLGNLEEIAQNEQG